MQCWNFGVLGAMQATNGVDRVEDLVGKKTGALLALLALSLGKTRSREELIDLLWPEVAFDEARDRFKQLLARLRKQLEPAGTLPGSVLVADRSQVGIAVGHQSDVAQFQSCLRQAALATEPLQKAQHLRAALTLYQGEFAPGFYLDVLLTERERLAELARDARLKLEALEARASPEPSRVPQAKEGFFGRDRERGALHSLLAEHRLVTLLGPGGAGKTRLSQELGVGQFVPLSTLTHGASLPETLVSALRLPDAAAPAEERLRVAKVGLLILDNVEQLVACGGPEAIQQLLGAVPTLRLLVTSRLKLDLPGERVFALAPLSHSDAVALFLDRARLSKPEFPLTPAVEELCTRLDGLPLALELAAARVAILTLQQILERLSRRFDLLADKRRDREERHRSLRATLDWGWGLLAPDVQRFFSQLCVFQGSFSLEAAEAVTDEPLAINYLQSLVDSSFLVWEQGRFRLLETLREYGSEKLSAAMRDHGEERHSAYFHAVAAQGYQQFRAGGFTNVVEVLREEQENLMGVLERQSTKNPERAIELSGQLLPFWDYTYQLRQVLPLVVRLEKSAALLPLMPEKRARWHFTLGTLFEGVKDNLAARNHYQYVLEALTDGEATTDDEAEAQRRLRVAAWHNLANVLGYLGELDAAERCYQDAAAVNRTWQYQWLVLNLESLCRLYRQRARRATPEEAVPYWNQSAAYAEEALDFARKHHNDYYLCYALYGKVATLFALHQQDDALPLLEEGRTTAWEVGHWDALIGFLYFEVVLARQRQQHELAQRLWGARQALVRQKELESDDVWEPGGAVGEAGQEEALRLEGEHASRAQVEEWLRALHVSLRTKGKPAENTGK